MEEILKSKGASKDISEFAEAENHSRLVLAILS
jgi:hypothetical protein